MRRRAMDLLLQAMVGSTLVCASGAVTFLRPATELAQGRPAKPGLDSLHVLSDSFQSLTRKVSPAVVQI